MKNNKLDAFQILSREGYMDILKHLPTDINSLMKKLGLSKMPMNRRVNELERVGVVRRNRGAGILKGNIELTKFGKEMIEKLK